MPNYQNLYNHFDGLFGVDTMTTTIARTGGGFTGDPVDAEIYYPHGCEGGYHKICRGTGDKSHKSCHKWEHCKKKGLGHVPSRKDFIDAFPMVPVLQGVNIPRAEYSKFAKKLASYGYVVVVPDLQQIDAGTEHFLTSEWVANWVVNDLTARDGDPTSPLAGIVDTGTMGLIGHSFGAGAASAVVQGTCEPSFCVGPPKSYKRPPSLKAAVLHGFQNCQTFTGQCFDPDTSAVPTAIVNGELDDPLSAYPSLERPRGLVVVDKMNHFGITNKDWAAPGTQFPEPSELTQEERIAATARWTAIWFAEHLLGSKDAAMLMQSGEAVDGFSVKSEL
jgi:Chlorophyllase enzyme